MNELKSHIIIGAIFVLIAGTISHFVYELSGNNVLVGFFFPINESTWEHMKLIFFPMLLYSLYAIKKRKPASECITSAFLLGTLAGTLLIPVLFYTYSGILGYNVMVLDLLTFVFSVLASFWVIYKAALSCKFAPYESLLKIIVFLMTVAFFYFTYFPPDIALFADPTVVSTTSFFYYTTDFIRKFPTFR